FNGPPTPHTLTLSLHDALPISMRSLVHGAALRVASAFALPLVWVAGHLLHARDPIAPPRLFTSSAGSIVVHEAIALTGTPVVLRSEEHTSELKSRGQPVCGLLL